MKSEESMKVRTQLSKRFAGITVLILVMTMGLASVAGAQESSKRTYSGDPPQSFVGAGGGGGDTGGGTADVADPGTLPFTGLDLGLAAGGALLLIGAGAAMAAATRRPNTE